MSNNSHSKEILLVAVLGVIGGGVLTSLLMSKKGKKVIDGIEDSYHDVKKKTTTMLSKLEKSLERGVNEKKEEWAEKVKDTIDQVKKQIGSIDIFEPTDLGKAVISFTILGAIVGIVGAALIAREKNRSTSEGLLDTLSSKASAVQPYISELCHLIEGSTECVKDQLNHHKEKAEEYVNSLKSGKGKGQEILDYAILGLKLWDTLKHSRK